MAKRSPFIQGFREPTLSKNLYLLLADVRGDGEGKLVIWSEEQSQLIVYKGSNRELQKTCKLRNVSGIIQYQDEERNSQAVIALSSENCLYIFRGLAESFRFKVPDIFAEQEEQIAWGQFEDNPTKLTQALSKIDPKLLSESARYFLNATTEERKVELIAKVFSEGINEKDSISAVAVLKSQNFPVGNIVVGTELGRLYILDSFGHSILKEKLIGFAPWIILAYGSFTDRYILILIGRDGEASFYMQNDQDVPAETIRSISYIVSACLNFPDYIIVSANQTLSHYNLSSTNFSIATKKYTLKLASQPICVDMIKIKGQKLTILSFPDQFRLYSEKELRYTYRTDVRLYKVIYGSFARQESCLILLYQQSGFEVLILHRQFNPKENYGTNKMVLNEVDNIPIPKKTSQFQVFWNEKPTDEPLSYRLYEKNLKLLKWRTLRERLTAKSAHAEKLQINSKIQGLGPAFRVILEIENCSEEVYFQVNVMIIYDSKKIQVRNAPNCIGMIPPMSPIERQVDVLSLSHKNQEITVELSWAGREVAATVYLPNCEQFA